MSKYHLGDKFIVDVKEVLESNNGTLYRSNFSTLVFDDYGLDKLQKYDEIGHKLELIDELKQAEYNRGLADAWELARKVYALELDEREKILGYQGLKPILEDLTPEYVADAIEAYEKEKSEIKVGDVVEFYYETEEPKEKGVVTWVLENGVTVVWVSGETEHCKKTELTKTGKHIDIESLLKEIGE